MFTSSGNDGVTGTVNQWSRRFGVSLRPWTGHSPLGLIIRGVIHVAICLFMLNLLIRLAKGDEFAASAEEMSYLRNFAILGIIAVVVLAALGALKVVVGVLDLVPRSTVTGIVLSMRSRKFGDFLPVILQRMIFERNQNAIDRRKERRELVLQTPDGIRQWTIRKARFANELTEGSRVQITVSPLIGYVASVQKTDAPIR